MISPLHDVFIESLGYKYLINLLTVIILFRFIYYLKYRNTELFLAFFGFNSVIFFVGHMLNEVDISTGAGFGLFAVFSILRYRTDGISAKNMTYLFMGIAVALITSLWTNTTETALFCLVVLGTTFLLEIIVLSKKEVSKVIYYDSIALIKPEQNKEFLLELNRRTGLAIHRVEIQSIDFLKDSCNLTVFYYED